MSVSLAEVEQQARMLAADERARLAEMLLESLQEEFLSEIETAWQREIGARVAAYDKGEMETYPAEQVFAEAKRITR